MDGAALQVDFSPLSETSLNLDQYAGLWAINETHGMQLWQTVNDLDLRAHVASNAGHAVDRAAVQTLSTESESSTKLVIISIEGVMTKRGSSMSRAGATIRVRQELRKAANDPSVSGILLRLDTPGGTVSGTADLAADVKSAATKKPVYGFAEDLCASAGYAVISQCTKVFANEPSALIGSIGTLMALIDSSGEHEKLGRKVIAIKAGELKGTGIPGTEITEQQIAYLQELVDDHQQNFNQSVATGRNTPLKTVAEKWAKGRVWSATEALSMGMIDGIQSLDTTLNQLAQDSLKSKPRGRSQTAETSPGTQVMTAQTTNETPAITVATIVAECAGLDIDSGDDAMFAMDCLKRNASIEEIRKNWMETLAARAAEREQELQEERQKKPTQSQPKQTIGVDPLEAVNASVGATNSDGSAGESFWAAVAEKVGKGMPRSRAVSLTVKEDPARHANMLEEHNAPHGREVKLPY